MRRVELYDMKEMVIMWMVWCVLMVADMILWRNQIVGNPTAVVSLQQTDLVTVMVTDSKRVTWNPTTVVGLKQTGPVMVMGPDHKEISS